jgi:SAM-dependent methyltransferase
VDYIGQNKAAWEEAYDNRSPTWGMDVADRLGREVFPFIQKAIVDEMGAYDFKGRIIGQFCCNNGRELLSLMGTGAAKGIGFDIAENQIAFANKVARQTGLPCEFVACDVLDIDASYWGKFDFLFITIGALCWFRDLDVFFGKVAACLKIGGVVIINEMHPVTNMLRAPGEEGYSEDVKDKLMNPYFGKTWEQNTGMSYITGRPSISRTFVSFSHSMSSIIGAMVGNSLRIRTFREFDYDISGGMFEHLDHQGIPLSYILTAERTRT